jgi:hypothetical protein
MKALIRKAVPAGAKSVPTLSGERRFAIMAHACVGMEMNVVDTSRSLSRSR